MAPSDITVVGLGYVGLPLALAFAKEFSTTGFDIDQARVQQLSDGFDRNLEVDSSEINSSELQLTNDPACISESSFIVVTVPTPVTDDFQPDLSLLESASRLIGEQLRGRSNESMTPTIVFESTTYPGCTEDFCGPLIEKESGLKSSEGFLLGYSPERTNYGDSEHTLETVVKVVAGQTAEAADVISDIYSRIAKAGTHLVADIRTAEASKVIENVQRDLNIALFNESAMIFDRMGINSAEVFEAAATKWNFHRYQPGLVGGHCIPVDPYYLTYAAQKVGQQAQVILSGRNVNEGMTDRVVEKIDELVSEGGRDVSTSRLLVLGQTFKKDVADFRNSKAKELAAKLRSRFADVRTYDPFDKGSESIQDPFESGHKYDAVVVAVGHSHFTARPNALSALIEPQGVFVDLVGAADPKLFRNPDVRYWSL